MSQPQEFIGRAMVFDLDGVLVDTMPAIRAVWREWAESRGLAPDAVLASIHMTGVELVREFAPDVDAPGEVAAIAARQASRETGVVPLPGAAEVIGRLPAGAWGIVTSARRVGAVRHLTMAGLPVPGVLITAEDTVRGKPDPAGYTLAAERLGVGASECLAVEDSPMGVRAAASAGMFTVGLATTHEPADVRHADVVVRSLQDVEVEVRPGEDVRRVRVRWKHRIEDLGDPA